MTNTYMLHGLAVASPFMLAAQATTAQPDVTLTEGDEAPVPDEAPAGTIMAELVVDDQRLYTAVRAADGYVLRFHGTCDFLISPDLSMIESRRAPGTDPGVVPLFLCGTVLSFVLTVAGRCVLHASSVEVDGKALAFVGQAGRGKSTVAAMLAAAGAPLITDDVLRVDVHEEAICYRGASQVRLRVSEDLDDAFQALYPADGTPSMTTDKRLALAPQATSHESLQLQAILVPRPSPDANAIAIERVPGADALLWLLSFPRVAGWSDPAVLQSNFKVLSSLARVVPVYEVMIPWVKPFRVSLGHELRSEIVAALGRDDALEDMVAWP